MALSVILIALNEEKNIDRCLAGLGFADEIIVVDGGSTDRTVDRAKVYTHRVFHRPLDDFASQKNYALKQASGEWILSIDADEVISPELKEKIEAVIKNPMGHYSAYAVRRESVFWGRRFRYSGLKQDRPVRLFKKKGALFERPVHEILRVDGPIGVLNAPLRHFSFQTFKDYLRRLQQYTSLEVYSAARRSEKKRAIFWSRPAARFLKIYIVEQGFRDGVEGFFYAVLSSYYEFVRWAKVWERDGLSGETR